MKRTFTALGLLGLFIAGSIGTQLGIDAAKAAFWQWSLTPANNGTADPTINWAEGMPPSVVNDSARAMMTRLVEQNIDTSGKIITGGTSTAYTATSNQGFPTPTPNDGQVIGVRFHVTNGLNPTLSVDGETAYPVLIATGGSVIAVPTSSLLQYTPYTLMFSVSGNGWVLRGVTGQQGSPILGVPIGGLVLWAGSASTLPPGYFLADGNCISQTTYALLYVALGSPGTGGCTAGNFRLIDMRGRAAAGLDTSPYTGAAGRLTSAAYGCATAMTSVGAVCAGGIEYRQLVATNIPTISGSASVSGSVTSYPDGNSGEYVPVAVGVGWTYASPSSGCCVYVPYLNAAGTYTNSWTGSSSWGGTSSSTNTSGGSTGGAFSGVPPTIAVNYIIRAL